MFGKWREKFDARVLLLEPGERYDIVGEASYQDALEAIAGAKTHEGFNLEASAFISPEPSNPYDKSAMRVSVAGKTVGYIPRGDTRSWHGMLTQHDADLAYAHATIVGGWQREGSEGNFGLYLSIAKEWTGQVVVNKLPKGLIR